MRQPLIYGLVVAACIFFVGWITGLGGSTLPNAVFSFAMGALAAGLFWIVLRRSGSRGD